jgi:hypothetical protein
MKKFNNYLLLLLVIQATTSCQKNEVNAPSKFEVGINSLSIKAGDTAKFTISGDAESILFYSGEPGNNYASKDILNADNGKPEMSFSSTISLGEATIGNQNLSILLSTDFNGKYNKEDILKATWINITSKFILPSIASTSTFSGAVDLSQYKVNGKSMYVAFKYVSINPALFRQRQWSISNFNFQTTFNNQTFVNANSLYLAGFGSFDFAELSTTPWNSITSSTTTSLTHAATLAGKEEENDWVISRGFDFSEANRNLGTVIKGPVDLNINSYSFNYLMPGNYKVVFVGKNTNINGSKEIVKEFNLTVTP